MFSDEFVCPEKQESQEHVVIMSDTEDKQIF